MRGFPLPASLQVSIPEKLLAETVELPQLFTIPNVGAPGTGVGLAVTELLDELVQPPTVCVTVNEPEVTVRGLPVPASLQVNEPVKPLAVIVELPQLFVTAKVGAAGAVGFAVTELLAGLTQPLIVCVTVNEPDVTERGLPVPASLQVSVPV